MFFRLLYLFRYWILKAVYVQNHLLVSIERMICEHNATTNASKSQKMCIGVESAPDVCGVPELIADKFDMCQRYGLLQGHRLSGSHTYIQNEIHWGAQSSLEQKNIYVKKKHSPTGMDNRSLHLAERT